MAETKEQVKHTPELNYEEEGGVILLVHGDTRFVLSQTSGELVGSDGHKISDLYWSDTDNTPEIVRDYFRAIVRAVNCHEELLQEARWMHAVLLQSEKHLMPVERDHLGEIALVIAKAEGR